MQVIHPESLRKGRIVRLLVHSECRMWITLLDGKRWFSILTSVPTSTMDLEGACESDEEAFLCVKIMRLEMPYCHVRYRDRHIGQVYIFLDTRRVSLFRV